MNHLTKTSLAALLIAGPALAETFDQAALLEAAQSEPPLFVIDSTGKVREQAANFGAAYGLEINATKSKAPATIRMLVGEAQAGNVQADVVVISDTPAATAQLLEPGYVTSYLPSTRTDEIPAHSQNPLIVSNSPIVFTYNTALNDTCPASNIWALTDADWKGHFAMQDPLGKPVYTDWFSQMGTHHDDAVAAAYEAHYGKPLETDYASATEAWVAALAANQPVLFNSDSDSSETVGAPDVTENFMGMMSTAKFRDNEDGYNLGICDTMSPMIGWMTPKFLLITAGTDSPNAARLYVDYLLSEEGWAPQAIDGKVPTNATHAVPEGEPSGVMNHMDKMWFYNSSTAGEDWNTRQDWQDFWALARSSAS
ncbi:MAG: ABC transporter substrate-binding protein [Pseudomonadota bacterium]